MKLCTKRAVTILGDREHDHLCLTGAESEGDVTPAKPRSLGHPCHCSRIQLYLSLENCSQLTPELLLPLPVTLGPELTAWGPLWPLASSCHSD